MLLQEHKQLFEQNTQIKAVFKNGQRVWPTVISTVDYSEPFYVENTTNSDETLSIKGGTQASLKNIEYSTNKTDWEQLTRIVANSNFTTTLSAHTKMYLRCSTYNWDYVRITGIDTVGGNIMSLLYGSDFTGNERTFPYHASLGYSQFSSLFSESGSHTLVNASNLILPATTLKTSCYANMFYGCTLLTNAPALPATDLSGGGSCYNGMFRDCTALTTVPSLPATTLSSSCYQYMFTSCTALTTTPDLPATILAPNCYDHMFSSCTSLTTVSSLPATTLAPICYQYMFYGCTSLTIVPSSLPATTLAKQCYQYMFSGCTSLVTSPVLAAPTLVQSCYNSMFEGCRNLVNITCLATDRSAQYATASWLYNASTTGTFTKAAGVEWPTGTSGIPEGWTIVEV